MKFDSRLNRFAGVLLSLALGIVTLLLLVPVEDDQVFKEYSAPAIPDKTRVMFVGNSITLHPSKMEIGWANNNGMAASSSRNDYVHKVIGLIGLEESDAYIRNFYPFETNSNVAQSHIESLSAVFKQRPDTLILQLGDNVKVVKSEPLGSIAQLYNFWVGYGELVSSARQAVGNVYCISTWWRSRIKDYVIRERCEAVGGHYVYIGDIYTNQDNPDLKTVDYSVAAVDAHPKDYGMNQIALRVKEAIDGSSRN